jgi:poly(3-hydroxybutyrate) depolymerase
MAGQAVDEYAIDPSRVFITGLSCGAMTFVMLATYPEVFAWRRDHRRSAVPQRART